MNMSSTLSRRGFLKYVTGTAATTLASPLFSDDTDIPAPQRIVLPKGWGWEIPPGQGLNYIADLVMPDGEKVRMICGVGGCFLPKGEGDTKELHILFQPNCQNAIGLFAMKNGQEIVDDDGKLKPTELFAGRYVTEKPYVDIFKDTRNYRFARTEEEIAWAKEENAKDDKMREQAADSEKQPAPAR